ncbi:Adhesion G-protein coupled receptor G4 [Eumeta japonica]|uniref:Adhesion G-protein coupled receptor G4 n=1 Tax=Eumeta variegata TaxID=151549 RepID=A0A4C1VZW1_EUMVA|nr:Adhesion G-protein coupled receptor G4 [Eumeta japonica]
MTSGRAFTLPRAAAGPKIGHLAGKILDTSSEGFCAQVTTDGCKTYSCSGDFTEGVRWVESEASDCARAGAGGGLLGAVTQLLPTEEDSPFEETSQTVPSTVRYLLKQLASRNDTDEDTSSTEEYSSTSHLSNETSPLPSTKKPPYKTTTSSEEVTTVTMPYFSTTSTPVTVDLPTSTSLPPEDQVLEVLDHLEQILHNDSVPVTVQVIDEAFNQVDDILNFSEEVDIPGELLQLLDELGARADLNGSHMGSSVRSNLALVIADASPEIPVRGIRIATRTEDAFTDDAFELLSAEVNSTQLESEFSEAVVQLPRSLGHSTRRISFVVFRNDRAFRLANDSHHYTVNSRILSINVENITEFADGEVIEMHFRPIVGELQRNETRTCAYWHFYEDGTGSWSQEGCTFLAAPQPGLLDTCRCTHLTHFAEVLSPRAVFSERNEYALEIISLIGCYMSLFGLICIGLTAALFRVWRRDFTNKVWLQLCVAIFVLIICFLVVVYARFQTYNVPCMLVGVALHYAVLASFCWMLVAAVLSYRRLVLVFNQDVSHKLLRASAFAWGVPCAVVGVLLSVDPHSYAGRFDEKTPSASFCYPTGLGLWLALYTPVAVMLLANWTLFGLIVYSVFASRRIQRHGGTNEMLRCATVSCLLVFLFGLPWIFGLFASNIVLAYLFTLTATFQGFVLFLFFVVCNKKTRDMWLNKLRIVQKRKVPVTSSTYKSSSRTAGSSSTAVSKAQYVKPRALIVSDDSGFS